MEIAFLFPIHNEQNRVCKALEFIKFTKGKFKKHKFVFLLNDCSDNTEKIIKVKIAKVAKFNNIIIIKSNSKNRGSGINLAIKNIKCKFFAVCAIDNAWSFDFYVRALKILKTSSTKVVFGSKSHSESKVKRTFVRVVISFLSLIFVKIVFNNKIDYDCQCIKMFSSDLKFIKQLNNYNYFSETEFALNVENYKIKKKIIPIKVKQTSGTKISIINLIRYCIDALHYRLFNFYTNKRFINKRYHSKAKLHL